LGSQKIAGLYTNDAYGIGVQDKVNADQSVSHAADEMFEAGSGDFRTQLTKIKSSGADTLIIVAHDEFPSILKQIRELGLQMKIIASETFKDTAMLAKSGSYAEEVYVPFLADQEDHLNFNNAYKVAFSEDSSAYSKYAYDGALALLKAIEDSGDDPDVVAAALFRKSFEGASGKVGFNTEGDRTGLVYLTYVVQGGSFVEY